MYLNHLSTPRPIDGPSIWPHICTDRPTTTRVALVWPEGASEQLQDCFNKTDWTVFEDDNIDTYYTSSVLFYIKCCMNNVTTTKQIHVFPKNKPWMSRGFWLLLKAHNTTFRSGDMVKMANKSCCYFPYYCGNVSYNQPSIFEQEWAPTGEYCRGFWHIFGALHIFSQLVLLKGRSDWLK